MFTRRRALSALAAAGLLPGATRLIAQTPPSVPAPPPTVQDRLSTAAAGVRHRLNFDGSAFSGPAWDKLLEQGRAAQFFLLGEEHGIAENPKLAAALLRALIPSGYSRLAIETSPHMAAELEAAAARGGVQGLREMLGDRRNFTAFFTMREEAEFLSDAQRALGSRRPTLWGLDYEVGADRRLIQMLKATSKPAEASVALDRLDAASAASWQRFEQTRNPQFIYSFSGDPQLVRDVRRAWPRANAQAQWILETLEETLEINRLFVGGRRWESNERRSALLRSNFLRHWAAETRGRRAPKVFLKFGASHMVRGRNLTETFDLGALLPEVAAMRGETSFHLLVLRGGGRENAAFDPSAFTYRPSARPGYEVGLEPITSQAFPDAFTLIEMRPLRPLLGQARANIHPELMRTVHGFDAVLVMSGSTPSAVL